MTSTLSEGISDMKGWKDQARLVQTTSGKDNVSTVNDFAGLLLDFDSDSVVVILSIEKK